MERTACTNEDTWHANQVNSIKPRRSRSKPRNTSWKRPFRFIKKIKFAKFDETVEVHMRLGVDPKHADQMVRGTVVMPNGLGKSKKVLVIASGDKQREAQEAGADFVGGEDMVNKIQSESWTDFDAVIATPDMMRSVGKLGKVLGPRGLMPNPKTGTVTVDVAKAIKEIKAGKVEFRVDKTGIIHAPVGKVSFAADKLVENAIQPDYGGDQGQAGGGQGQVREERDRLLHHGPGRFDRYRAIQCEGGRLSRNRCSHEKEGRQEERSRGPAAGSGRSQEPVRHRLRED